MVVLDIVDIIPPAFVVEVDITNIIVVVTLW